MQYKSKIRWTFKETAFGNRGAEWGIVPPLGRGLGWVVLVVGLIVAGFAATTGNTEAHSPADHDGHGPPHCEYMHSHPTEQHGPSETYYVPEGYEQYNGYVHCHGTRTDPTSTSTLQTSTGDGSGTGGGGGSASVGETGGGGVTGRVNLRPRLDIDSDTVTYRENGIEPVAGFAAVDPDEDNLRWRLEGPDRRAFRISDDGALSFRESPDYENPGDQNGDNEFEITLRVEDDGSPSLSDSEGVRIRVTDENELGAVSGDVELSIAEGKTGALSRYQAEDPEDDEISWSLTGADGDFFRIDSEGNLSLHTALDYESSSAAGTDTYSVTITAEDDGSPQKTSQLTMALTVTNVNEAPNSAGILVVELQVGGEPVRVNLADYFTDPDGDVIAYAIDVGAGGSVVAAAVVGDSLSMVPTAAGSVSFKVTGSDPGGLNAIATMQATVIDPEPEQQTVSLNITLTHDEIVLPYQDRDGDSAAPIGEGDSTDSRPSTTAEEDAPIVEPTREPVPAVSMRKLPEQTPSPTPAAAVREPSSPTAMPMPIATAEPEPTQAASQRPATPEPPVASTATPAPAAGAQAAESVEDEGQFPWWLILLLILLGLILLASLPVAIVNLAIIAGMIALALALGSSPAWLVILLAAGVMVGLGGIGLAYGIVTRKW